MTAPSEVSQKRIAVWIILVTLIVIEATRLLWLAKRWSVGQPAAYPGEYRAHLLNALQVISFSGIILISQTTLGLERRGRLIMHGLVVLGVGAFAFEIISGP